MSELFKYDTYPGPAEIRVTPEEMRGQESTRSRGSLMIAPPSRCPMGAGEAFDTEADPNPFWSVFDTPWWPGLSRPPTARRSRPQ